MNLSTQKAYHEAVREALQAQAEFRAGRSAEFELHLMQANCEPCATHYLRLADTCAAKEAALKAELTLLRKLRRAALAAA